MTAGGQGYDVVVVGSGFGSLFFLQRFLDRPRQRVLMLEWGETWDNATQLEHGKNGAIDIEDTFTYRPEPGGENKVWHYTIGTGGGTNCWYAQTPRPLPSDFELATRFGVGMDWPLSYDELEPYLSEAEEIMAISGEDAIGRFSPRSRPYPQPPHRGSQVDRLMKAAQPELHFAMPCARARVPTANRPACCASNRCYLCPVNAKFTGLAELDHIFSHENLDLVTGAKVLRFETEGGLVKEAVFEKDGRIERVRADFFVLGANSIQSPAILLASGIDEGPVGQGLHETHGYNVEVLLDGVQNYDGSTITTGINYSLTEGDFRKDHAAVMLFFENRWMHGLRPERGRWRESLSMLVLAEEIPDLRSRVTLNPSSGAVEVITVPGSDYAERGFRKAMEALPDVLAPLPVEEIRIMGRRWTEGHVQGSLRMGARAGDSVVDGRQIHHRYRNLMVVGASVFPTCLNATPSLTAAALSLRAAELL